MKSSRLVQDKTPKASNAHLHLCLVCFEKHTKWAYMQEERKKTSPVMKRKANFSDSTNFNNDGV